MDERAGDGLGAAIKEVWGSFANFKQQFTLAALEVFGSGWAWLVWDGNNLVTHRLILPHTIGASLASASAQASRGLLRATGRARDHQISDSKGAHRNTSSDDMAWQSIEGTANQDSPLMNGKSPLLGLDVWEVCRLFARVRCTTRGRGQAQRAQRA